MNDRHFKNFVIGVGLGASGFAFAAVTLPNTFTAGTPIVAAQVNDNFAALKTALETASGINAGAIGVSKLSIGGAIADGKVLKAQGGNLVWGDDLTGGGGAAYTAGTGLALAGSTFSVNFAGSGAANTAARSDHDHYGQTWTGAGTLGLGIWVNAPVPTSGNVYGLTAKMATGSGITPGQTAAVWGDNLMGTGVYATSKNGLGLWAESSNSYGVYGKTSSTDPNFAGVAATGRTALYIDGGITIVASGSNVNAPMTQIDASSTSGFTVVDNPNANGNAAALVSVTVRITTAGASPKPVATFYDTVSGRWRIYTLDNSNQPSGVAYVVFVARTVF